MIVAAGSAMAGTWRFRMRHAAAKEPSVMTRRRRRHGRPITKADIEAKLAEIGGEVDGEVAGARHRDHRRRGQRGVRVAVTFVLGRRRGKRLTTIVEIRRV